MSTHIRKMIVFSVSLVLVFVFCSVSDAVNLKKAIIGKWIPEDGKVRDHIEFLKDGTVIFGSAAGDYRFIDDNRLKVDLKIAAKVFEVSIDKEGALILKEPTGAVNRYIAEKAYPAYIAKLEAQRKAEEERKRKAAEERLKKKFQFSDLTVLDEETKLMWTRDGNIAGKNMTWDNAFNFIKQLNEQKYAGYNDWRLPSKKELETLLDFVKSQGYSKNFHPESCVNYLSYDNTTY